MASRNPKPHKPCVNTHPLPPARIPSAVYRERLVTSVIKELSALEDWFGVDNPPRSAMRHNLPLDAFYQTPYNLAIDQLEQLLLLVRVIHDMSHPTPTVTALRDVHRLYKAKLRSLKKGL